MRITHLNTYDIAGGAARAAFRLHKGLCSLGHESQLFSLHKQSFDPTVVHFDPPRELPTRLRRVLKRRILNQTEKYILSRPAGSSVFSDDRSPHNADILLQLPKTDILHLHWIAGFIDYRLFFRKLLPGLPVVWTLHDMNPFTGGCHFDNACGRFTVSCGACPQLARDGANGLSHKIWQRKQTAFASMNRANLHLVTPSQWLAREVRRSALFADRFVSVIPYGVDTEIFRPRDRNASRDVLGLPPDARVILFLADWVGETRKGFSVLQKALAGIQETASLFLLTLGNGAAEISSNIPAMNLRYLDEEKFLSLVYSAADLFVLPALQDNLPNTALEALACGVPIVAFDIGGIPDMVRDGVEGRLVPGGDVEALQAAICDLLAHPETLREMGCQARRRAVQEYRLELQAQRYVELYGNILASLPRESSPGFRR